MNRGVNEGLKLTIVPEMPLSDEIEISVKQSVGQLSVGKQLMMERTKQNLSIVQIADQLKWSLRQITEIEAGNYAVLHDPSSVRGFIRTYAKKLKLDAAPLLEALSIEFSRLPMPFPDAVDRSIPEASFSVGRMPWLGRPHHKSHRILWGLFLILISLLVLFLFRTEADFFVRNLVTENKEIIADTPTSVVVGPGALVEASLMPKSSSAFTNESLIKINKLNPHASLNSTIQNR